MTKSRGQINELFYRSYLKFKEEPSQFSMGQTTQSLTCSIMEKPHTGLGECPSILLSCFRARNSASKAKPVPRNGLFNRKSGNVFVSFV